MLKAAVAIFAILVASCAPRASILKDDWFRAAPDGPTADLTKVDERDIHPVTEAKLEAAKRKLETISVAPISASEAEELVNSELDGSSFFLIRGLCLGCGTGLFSAYSNGRSVLIDHVSLAGRGTPATRWPVVVRLDRIPSEVFVQCHAIR
jgi:hypothetical protein